jgi:hypothetical protein
MFIAYCVVAVLTSLVLVFSASIKFTKAERAVETLHEKLGVPLEWFPFLGACEVAGALGLLAGTAPGLEFIGVLAALGLILYAVGAVVSHVRVKDYEGVPNAVVLLGLSIGALVLRLAT